MPIFANFTVFGIPFDPALLAFLLLFVAFAVLNYIDKKRID